MRISRLCERIVNSVCLYLLSPLGRVRTVLYKRRIKYLLDGFAQIRAFKTLYLFYRINEDRAMPVLMYVTLAGYLRFTVPPINEDSIPAI
jgi:hypothetical protein